MGYWHNEDGLTVRFGNELARKSNQEAGIETSHNMIRVMHFDWEYDNLPTFSTDDDNDGTFDKFSDEDVFIPTGSLIVRAYTLVKTAFAGGTSYNMGFYNQAGTVIDAAGLDAAVAVAAMAADLAVVHDGALVGGTVLLTANAYPVFAATGTYTAGKARTVIEFIPPRSATFNS